MVSCLCGIEHTLHWFSQFPDKTGSRRYGYYRSAFCLILITEERIRIRLFFFQLLQSFIFTLTTNLDCLALLYLAFPIMLSVFVICLISFILLARKRLSGFNKICVKNNQHPIFSISLFTIYDKLTHISLVDPYRVCVTCCNSLFGDPMELFPHASWIYG